MRNSGQNICPNCRRPMTLELQPGGKSPRTFQCLDCDRPDDPINSPAVMGMIDASAASEAVSVIISHRFHEHAAAAFDRKRRLKFIFVLQNAP